MHLSMKCMGLFFHLIPASTNEYHLLLKAHVQHQTYPNFGGFEDFSTKQLFSPKSVAGDKRQFQKSHRYSVKNDCRGQLACTAICQLVLASPCGQSRPEMDAPGGEMTVGDATPPSWAPVEIEVLEFTLPKLCVPT